MRLCNIAPSRCIGSSALAVHTVYNMMVSCHHGSNCKLCQCVPRPSRSLNNQAQAAITEGLATTLLQQRCLQHIAKTPELQFNVCCYCHVHLEMDLIMKQGVKEQIAQSADCLVC